MNDANALRITAYGLSFYGSFNNVAYFLVLCFMVLEEKKSVGIVLDVEFSCRSSTVGFIQFDARTKP